MKRRTFIKKTGSAGALAVLTPAGLFQTALKSCSPAEEKLTNQMFLKPPVNARPYTWWHWMNGNVTKEGITKDLEEMKEAGLGGFQMFEAGIGIPQGPIEYLSEEWHDLAEHAINEAKRLGLEFGMHNCPGWSSSGGPWVTPEMGMQHLSWTESFVNGGKTISKKLPQPYFNLDYYKDVIVLAFPSLPGEKPLDEQIGRLSSNNGDEDIKKLTGEGPEGLDLLPPKEDSEAFLIFEFNDPFEVRNLIIESLESGYDQTGLDLSRIRNRSAPGTFYLESSYDGIEYTRIADIGAGSWGFGGSSTLAARIEFSPVITRFFRIATTVPRNIFRVNFSGVQYIPDISVIANFSKDWSNLPDILDRSRRADVAYDQCISPDQILDITGFMDQQGVLTWDAPDGAWTILRVGHTAIGTTNRSAPATGTGLEVDKYSSEALDFHFENMFERLLPMLKPLTREERVGLLIDSYEVGMQTWTKEMFREFQERHKYDLRKFLPAITGRYIQNVNVTNRILHDFRRTCADLIADNYYGRFNQLCEKYGIISYVEPICRGPMEEFQIASLTNVPMGEFWSGLHLLFPHNIEHRRSLKLSASATHIHGSKIVGAEAFTAEPHAGKWQQYPFSMKAMGDYYFTEGVNRFIFHRFAHQPQNPDVKPGMTMGQWGVHFEWTNTWWRSAQDWLKYISRCQYMLQQGLFVADLLYHTGDLVPRYTDIAREDLLFTPPEGCDYSMINTASFLERVSIRDGLITLPDGMTYKMFILSKYPFMSIELARRLHELVRQGMILVGPKPEGTLSLTDNEHEAEFSKLVDEMWGDTDGLINTEHSFGRGLVFNGPSIAQVMDRLNIKPDFEHTSLSGDAPAHFIHLRINDADVYLVTNPRRQKEELVCTFRINNKKPEFWNAENGRISECMIYDIVDGRVRVPVQLDEYGSLFVVFRSAASSNKITAISKDGQEIIKTSPYRIPPVGMYADLYDDFSISLWVKPEIDIGLGSRELRSYKGRMRTDYYLFYPTEGETAYGSGHAACSITVGRNGVVVWERSKGDPVDVLIAETPVSGWTHLTLVYNQGKPFLYLNGDLIQEGEASGMAVHPGIGDYIPHDGMTYYYYNGGMTDPDVHDRVLSETQIRELASAKLPEPSPPRDISISCKNDNEIIFWNDGDYQFSNGPVASGAMMVKGTGELADLSTGWEVFFPPGLGAPHKIYMNELVSLNRHEQDGVKYFSGTASYRKQFELPLSSFSDQIRIYLDIGRVEVIAEVILNDLPCGIIWKPPFRIDISDELKAGLNDLEVKVTNLWPNRLIGDEQLPEEYQFGSGQSPTGGIRELPGWFIHGEPKPSGERVTFTTWRHYNKDSPLLESGMIGPVKLRKAINYKLHSKRN